MHLGERGIFADRAAKDDVTVASVALARLCLNSVLCDIRRELREGGVVEESS